MRQMQMRYQNEKLIFEYALRKKMRNYNIWKKKQVSKQPRRQKCGTQKSNQTGMYR